MSSISMVYSFYSSEFVKLWWKIFANKVPFHEITLFFVSPSRNKSFHFHMCVKFHYSPVQMASRWLIFKHLFIGRVIAAGVSFVKREKHFHIFQERQNENQETLETGDSLQVAVAKQCLLRVSTHSVQLHERAFRRKYVLFFLQD